MKTALSWVSLGAAGPLPSNMSVVSMFVCVGEKRRGKEKIAYGNYVELQIRSFTWFDRYRALV